MKLILTTFLWLIISIKSISQIKGVVVSKENQTPIKSVSVFINNSTIGTISAADGSFELKLPSEDNYFEIVFSCIGFKTQTKIINANHHNEFLKIELVIYSTELEDIEIKSDFEATTWDKWGKTFLRCFIGTNPNAKDCEIINTQAVKLRYSKKRNILKAISDTFLIINNKALGYKISYKLEKFEFQIHDGYLFYGGYPFFEAITSDKKREKIRWEKARQKAYYGSTMHFVRSLFANQLNEEGFIVNKMVKYENVEKKRVLQIYKKTVDSIQKVNNGVVMLNNRGSVFGDDDSSRYYEEILKQKDLLEHVYPENLTANHFAFRNKNNQIIVFFKDYLRVEYTKAIEEDEYLHAFQLKRNPANQTSTLTLINDKAIEIFSNGLYFPTIELLRSGYWSWSDKMSTMLPLDYNP